jgi:hypothetical protein
VTTQSGPPTKTSSEPGLRERWRAAYDDVVTLEWPIGGLAIVYRLWPTLSGEIDRCEAAGLPERWRGLIRDAVERLSSCCHDCGSRPIATVVADDGYRLCVNCLKR